MTGRRVTLEQVLAARDARAAAQQAALAKFNKPIVCTTVITPGPVKDGVIPRYLFGAATDAVDVVCSARRWIVVWREILWKNTGPEAIYVVDSEAERLKIALVDIENRLRLGRLWDLDVITPRDGRVSRRALGYPPRRCLLCDEPAHACGRARRHSTEELSDAIQQMVHAHDSRARA